MADSKKYNGSQWEHSLRKLTTATEAVENPLYSDGTAITSYTISGNTAQDGTPTPDNPVEVNGVGERTGNLFPLDATKLHVGRIENDGTIDYEIGTITVGTNSVTYQANVIWRGFYTDYIQANADEKLTFSSNNSSNISLSCNCYDENDNFLGKASSQSTALIRIFTMLAGTKKIRINVTSSLTEYTITNPILNTGSTALPYEPFGVKIPISNGGVTTNIYLGSTQTVRKIKKLVLTGDEYYGLSGDGTDNAFFYTDIDICQGALLIVSSHFEPTQIYTTNTAIGIMIAEITAGLKRLRIRPLNTSTYTQQTFKQWLAAQYAAGTPVTIWYVLATPETAAVNEPLMKIGDYADTLSNAASIPTTEGANSIIVDTTVQPSEFTATWTGWHDAIVHERTNGAWA